VVALHVRAAQVGTKIEQVVGDTGQRQIGLSRRVLAREGNGRVGLIDRAIRADAGGMLGNPHAVAKRGVPGIAGLGVDF